MKTINKILLSVAAAVMAVAACTPVEQGTQYGDLAIFYNSDELSVEAGGTLPIPFAVLGAEGVALKLEAVSSDPETTLKLKYDATYSGTIEFTSPIVVASQRTAEVTLKVSDSHGRKAEQSTTVTMLPSEPLIVKLTDDIKSIAVKANGSFSLPFVVTGKGNATISDNITLTATSGWTVACEWNSDKTGGKINVTAPGAPANQLNIKMGITDSYNRTAELDIPLSIVTITTAAGAANCYIAAPGSTLTIKGVKGNSATELDFNNAELVWQDQIGLVKSVSGNGTEKVIVVELNSGKAGNAVVAAKKDGVIVWSWHLWVSDYDPDADPMVYTSTISGTTYTFMDRNLGAYSNKKDSAESFGLFYQWGRKDPFVGADGVESSVYVKKYDMNGNIIREASERRPVYENDYTATNLELSIQNPTVFYHAPSSAWPVVDWLTDDAQRQDNDLWGGVSKIKSIYDPCPEGWMIPEAGDCWTFRKQYYKAGTLQDSAKYDESYPWYIEYDPSLGFRYKTTDGKEYWFPFAGRKDCGTGDLLGVGGGSQYHTRTVLNTTVTTEVMAWGNPTSESGLNRPYGNSVRCIKETK